jgi:hypothetical protein
LVGLYACHWPQVSIVINRASYETSSLLSPQMEAWQV